MKPVKYLIALSFALASCQGFLDVELDREIVTAEAIVNRETAEAATIGLYNSLQNLNLYGSDFVVLADLLGGNAIATGFQPRYQELADARVPTTNAFVESSWVRYYRIVNSANNILAHIDDIDGISPEARARIKGTAYFFRALSLFDLLRQFGEFTDLNSAFGVPVFTAVLDRSTAPAVGRASVAETYALILNDLKLAEGALPNSSDRFFVSQAAARALLARVYLYQKDYANARAYAEQVIADGKYSLNADYADNFRVEGSGESIFELNFISIDGNGLSRLLMLPAANEVSGSNPLWNAFADGDARKGMFLRRFGITRCIKYGELATDIETNVLLFRLAEMYLIQSEAIANTLGPADALESLNAVRLRARPGVPIEVSQVPDLAAFNELLLQERRLELAFEGHYWFDLVRLGKAVEARGIEPYRQVLPIPEREIRVSDGVLVQNPGY